MSSGKHLDARFGDESAGDCPNPACQGGQIVWQRWTGPTDVPPVYAGRCARCGRWAAQCPLCGDLVPLDHELFECSCEAAIRLIPGGSPPHIELVTPDDVRRTYALPDK